MMKFGRKPAYIGVAFMGVIAGMVAGSLYYGNKATAPAERPASVTLDIGGQRFIRWESPRELPSLSFRDESGKPLTLADFSGRVVLLNIWATWCPPCRHEMPSLDRLNAMRAGPGFEVVALSIDIDPAVVLPFFREIGIKTLRGYFDSQARASIAVGAAALPVTLLIDKNGREIGRALGPAEWDSAAVVALIDAAQGTGQKQSAP